MQRYLCEKGLEMRILMALVVVAGVAALLAGTSLGRTIYVRPDGGGDVATIQAGMDSAAVRDTLLLASGTFVGAGNHDLVVPGKALVFRSETGDPADCTIDCEGQFGFEFWTGRTVVEGIGITGAGANAARVYYDGGPSRPEVTFSNCDFTADSGLRGGAIYIDCSFGWVTIRDCEFGWNSASYDGGAIYAEGGGASLEVYVRRCVFHDNSARDWGGAICLRQDEVWVSIETSLFYRNIAGAGGAASTGYVQAHFSSCTFVANSAVAGSAIDAGERTTCLYCLISYGEGGCGFFYEGYEGGDPPDIRCTDIYGNEGGDWVGGIADQLGQYGNFSACPGFYNFDIERYDLRLCDTSPCLPGNNPNGYNCPLVGAFGQGCTCGPSETQPSTWGAIKAMYR
jgi:hypothetical protein